MSPTLRGLLPRFVVLGLLTGSFRAHADDRVVLVATASEEYSRSRVDSSGQPRVQTYVVMEGKKHEGTTSDRSTETTSFRQIAGALAPELAKQHYLPARAAAGADLLLIVQRGTTTPRVTDEQLRGIVTRDPSGGEDAKIEAFKKQAINGGASPGTAALLDTSNETFERMRLDQVTRDTDTLSDASRTGANSHLLGYGQQLNRMNQRTISTPQEDALRLDLTGERYFLVVRAYDLKAKPSPGGAREPVWVLYVNMSTSGQDFGAALTQMSVAAKDYFGRSTEGIQTLRPAKGNVQMAPLVIEGEVKRATAESTPAPKSP